MKLKRMKNENEEHRPVVAIYQRFAVSQKTIVNR